MPNPWDNDPIVQPAAPSATGARQFPGVIQGAPDPYKAEDQQMQRDANARAAASADRQAAAAERQATAAERQATKDGAGTEGQQKIATLLTRIAGGFRDIQNVTATDPSAQEPGLIETMRGGLETGGLTGAPVRALAGANRRMVHDAQLDALDALLTLGTGAAYNPEQLSGQKSAYFPAYHDTPAEIALKNQRMLRLIEAAKANAGPAWAQVEPAIAPYMKTLSATPGATTQQNEDARKQAVALWGQEVYDSNGAPLGPDGGEGFDQNGKSLGMFGSVTDTSPAPPPPPTDTSASGIGRGIAQGTGSMVAGLGDMVGIVGNPLNATINAATGSNLSTDLGGSLRDALGLPKNTTGTDTVIRAGTGAGVGSLAARGLAALANPGTVQNALALMGRTPIADMASGAGAGAGTDYAQRNNMGGMGQVVGAVVGGLAGGAGANALARSVQGVRVPNALMQSADELGVTMMPADVGGVGTRMATGAFGRTLGGIPIAEGAQKAISSAGSAKGRIASAIGDIADNVGAGQAAKRGFGKFEQSSMDRAGQLYDKVSVPADAQVQLGQTRGALAEVTRGMQSNPELSRLWANHPRLRATLEALTPQDVASDGRVAFGEASDRLTKAMDRYEQLRNAITDPRELTAARQEIDAARTAVTDAQKLATTPPQGGQLSWEDMKRFRSIVGEIIGQPGVSADGSDIAGLRKLYAALSSDMEVTAAQQGPRALSEFRRASQYWAGRQSRIDDVFATLLGKDGNRSDEAVFKQINSWANSEKGDFGRLARTIRSMPDDEANTIRATLIQRMGLQKAAGQDATGEVFSPALFATQWRGMSDRAKAVLFPNQQHRQDLEKLAGLMDGMKRADQYQNFSNTSLGVNLTTQGALAYASLPAAVATAAVQFGAGKLLASPRFARLIASTVRMPPEAAQRKLGEQLGVIAAREPMLATDAKALQDYLAQTFSQSPVRAAASEKERDRRGPPPAN